MIYCQTFLDVPHKNEYFPSTQTKLPIEEIKSCETKTQFFWWFARLLMPPRYDKANLFNHLKFKGSSNVY